MKKVLYTLFFALIPTLLLSKNYCIQIDQFDYNINNKSNIYTILNDIAYPSTKIEKNQLFIYSGKFKSFEDATKLLLLTKSRYKNAKVASCEGAILYKNESLFQTEAPKMKEKVAVKKKSERPIQKNYCLQVFDASLKQSAKQKNLINYAMQRLPETKTEVKNGRFYIYSGNFPSKESANTIAKVLKKEFKNTRVTECPIREPLISSSSLDQNVQEVLPTKKSKAPFSVTQLDDKGYISNEIASNRDLNVVDNLKKSDIKHALDTQRDEYFNGLYLKTNTAFDIQNDDSAYDVRLEFDIFAQGYYENKKKNEKNRVDNQINFYRAIKHIEVLKKEQELLKIKKYENAINVSALLLKLRVTESNLNSAKAQLNSGVLTEYEYETYILKIQEIKDELLLFKNMTLLKIPKDLWILLNDIENTRLIPEEKLLQLLEQDSVDLKLAKTLQDKQPLGEEWSDKLRVNVYAGARKMYLSQNQTLIGVEAKIPLSNYSKTKEFSTIQNSVMSEQVRLQHSQSKEVLRDAIATFKYKQKKLKTYSYELARVKKRIKDLELINNSAYASYANLSFNSKQNNVETYLEKYALLQKERINTYKELINIMYLIHSNDIKNILQYAIRR